MLRLALSSSKRAFVRPLFVSSFRSYFIARHLSSTVTNSVRDGNEDREKLGLKFEREDFGSDLTKQKSTIDIDTIQVTNLYTNEELRQDSISNTPILEQHDTKENTDQNNLNIPTKDATVDLSTESEAQSSKEKREQRESRDMQESAENTPAEERTLKYYSREISIALAHSIDDVFRLCMEMKQAKIKPDVHIMNLVITAFARTRCSDQAFIMFDQMKQLGIKPNTFTLEFLLTACDISAEMYRAQQIIHRMREYDIWPTMAAHSYLISIYVKNNQYELAWAEYEVLKALNNATLPDVLGNFFRLVLTNGDSRWIYNLLLEMYNNEIEYTKHEIARCLEIFLGTKELKGCLLLFKIDGGSLEEGSLVKILNLAAQMQDKQACDVLFDAIRTKTQGAPSRIAYFAWLSESIYSHNVPEFLDRVNEMSLAGHQLGGVYAIKFARICDTTAQIDKASTHLSATKAAGHFVGVDALSAIMRACARLGDMDRAIKTFTDCLKKYQLIPDIEGFNSIIESSEKAGNLTYAENVITQMAAHGVQPSVSSFETLIRLCVRASDLPSATRALSTMASFNLQPTYQIYAGLAGLCAELGEYDQAHAIVNSMIEAGMKPAETLVLGIQPYHRKRYNITQTQTPQQPPPES